MNSVKDEEKGSQITGQDGRHSWGLLNSKACSVASVCFISTVGPSSLAGKSVSLPVAFSALGSWGNGVFYNQAVAHSSPQCLYMG